VYGTVIATGAGDIDYLEIDGSLADSGQITAADLDTNNQPLPDTGNIGTLIIGSDDTPTTETADGNIVTGDLDDLNVNGDVNGTIHVGNLDSGTIDGDMNGLIEATGDGTIDFLSIGGDLGGDILAPEDTLSDGVTPDPDTGIICVLTIGGGVTDTGSVVTAQLDSGTIDGDMNGLIEATGQGEIT